MDDIRAANVPVGTATAGVKCFVRKHRNSSLFIYRSRWFNVRSPLSASRAVKSLDMPEKEMVWFQSCRNTFQ